MIPLEASGRPVRRVLVWLDTRALAEAAAIGRHFGTQRVFEVTGQPDVIPMWTAAKTRTTC